MPAERPHRQGTARISWFVVSAYLLPCQRVASQDQACHSGYAIKHVSEAGSHRESRRESPVSLLQVLSGTVSADSLEAPYERSVESPAARVVSGTASIDSLAPSGRAAEVQLDVALDMLKTNQTLKAEALNKLGTWLQFFQASLASLGEDSLWDWLPSFMRSDNSGNLGMPEEKRPSPIAYQPRKEVRDKNDMGPERGPSRTVTEEGAEEEEEQEVEGAGSGEAGITDTGKPLFELTSDYFPPPCRGVTSKGRCWYLSEPGEDCMTTCLAHGRAYRFGIASKSLMPKLLGFKPKHEGGPWMAFDTYNANENKSKRFSMRSANDYRDKDGTWSSTNFQIACPCGGVTECFYRAPASCEPRFVFQRVSLKGCTTVGQRGDPWCQHHRTDESEWSYCTRVCVDASTGYVTESIHSPPPHAKKAMVGPNSLLPAVATETSTPPPLDDDQCMWTLAEGCWPEFDYGPDHLVGCTRVDHQTPWCSKAKLYNGSWAHCIFTCKDISTVSQNMLIREQNYQANAELELCTWTPAKECANRTTFAGVEYEGCVRDDDDPMLAPWCSHDEEFAGKWTHCIHICRTATNQKDNF